MALVGRHGRGRRPVQRSLVGLSWSGAALLVGVLNIELLGAAARAAPPVCFNGKCGAAAEEERRQQHIRETVRKVQSGLRTGTSHRPGRGRHRYAPTPPSRLVRMSGRYRRRHTR